MKSQYLIVLLFSVFCVLSFVHSEQTVTQLAVDKTKEAINKVTPSPVQGAGANDTVEALRAMMVPDVNERSNLRISHFRSLYVLAPCLSWFFMGIGYFMATIGSPNHFFVDLSLVITVVATLNYVRSDTFKIAAFEAMNTLLFTSIGMVYLVANRHIQRAKVAVVAKKGLKVEKEQSNAAFFTLRLVQLVAMFFNVLGVTYFFTTPELFFSLQFHRMLLERLTPLTNWAVILSTVGLYFDSVFSTAFVVETFATVLYWVLYLTGALAYPPLGKEEMKKLRIYDGVVNICTFDFLLHGAPLLFLIVLHLVSHKGLTLGVLLKSWTTFVGVLTVFASYIGMYAYATFAQFKGPYKFVEKMLLPKNATFVDASTLQDHEGVGLLMNGLTDMMLFLYEILFYFVPKDSLVAKSKAYVTAHPANLASIRVAFKEAFAAEDARNAAKAAAKKPVVPQ